MKQKFFNVAVVLAILILSFGLNNQVSAQSADHPKTTISPDGDVYNLGAKKTVNQIKQDEAVNGSNRTVSNPSIDNSADTKVVKKEHDTYAQVEPTPENSSNLTPLTFATPIKVAGTNPNVLRQFMAQGKGSCTADNINKFTVGVNGWMKQDANNIQMLNQTEMDFINANDFKSLYHYLYSTPAGK